jgi:hypothetical protein
MTVSPIINSRIPAAGEYPLPRPGGSVSMDPPSILIAGLLAFPFSQELSVMLTSSAWILTF